MAVPSKKTDPQALTPSGCYVPQCPADDPMQALVSIGRALTGKLDLERVLAAALDAIGRLAGAEAASILLIDPQTQEMSFHAAAGPGAQTVRTLPLPAGAGICGHVARTGEPLIVNDAQSDGRLYRQVDKATGMTTRNLLCVPIRSPERLWGVLEVINKRRGRDFGEDDLRLAEAFAFQTAMALENAHLHAQVVRKERMAAIGQTVSGLAHCIKNILNGIRSGSAVVDRAMETGEQARVREGWGVVRRNNEMLGNLVLDMLSLARESQPHSFPTDVNDLAGEVCALVAARAQERGIAVRCAPQADLGEVMLDPTYLYRCLLNLLSNAVEACGEGKHVRVGVRRGGRRNRFTVSVLDDGSGIAPPDQRRLFQEFFTTKGAKGTGLGLAVTRKLLTQMGGSIAFHSVAGRGTRFVMCLPIEADQRKKETVS